MILDIIIVSLVGFAAYRGMRKGAISMVASLVILIGSVIIATVFGTSFGKSIGLGPTLLHPVTGFFILLFILLFLGSFLKKWIKPKRGMFSGADKFLGLVLGALRAILILGLLAGFLRIFQYPTIKVGNASTLYPLVLRTSSLIITQMKPLVVQLSSDVYEDLTPADSSKSK